MDPVLVATNPRPTIRGAWHPGMFTHAIASLRLGQGERVFMDPTATHVPFGHLPTGDLDKRALVLDSRAPTSLRLPTPDPRHPASLTVVVAPLAEDPGSGRAHFVIRGLLLHAIQGMRRRPGSVPWQRRVAQALSRLLSALELRDLRLVREDPESLTVRADVDLRRLVLRAGPHVFVRRAPQPPCPPRVETRAGDSGPLMLPPPFGLDIRIRFPAQRYSLQSAPRLRHAAGNVAWVDSWAAQRGEHLELGLQMGRRRRYLAQRNKAAYLRFCRRARPLSDGWFALLREATP
jgi:hypothetical protein